MAWDYNLIKILEITIMGCGSLEKSKDQEDNLYKIKMLYTKEIGKKV